MTDNNERPNPSEHDGQAIQSSQAQTASPERIQAPPDGASGNERNGQRGGGNTGRDSRSEVRR